MKTSFVTGGAGFIGSAFVRLILDETDDFKIINYDALTYAGNRASLKSLDGNPRLEFVQGDICDAALVWDLLVRCNIDTIVHFAAESHVDRSIDGPANKGREAALAAVAMARLYQTIAGRS